MDRRLFLRTTTTIATAGLAALAGCAGDSDDAATRNPTETNTITMVSDGGNNYFDPIGLFVETGETVTWEVESGTHTSTAYSGEPTRVPEGAEAWESDRLSESGATFEHTFDVAGTYDYFCTPHKSLGMVGRIVVGESGGPAEGSMPPDGDVPESQTIVEEGAVMYDEFSG